MDKNKAHEVFLTFLKKGYRITPQRFEELDNALDINNHFTADELYNKMKSNNSKVSRATVYNTIELLVKCDILSKRIFNQTTTMFEINFNRKQHDHIICEECGKIWEFSAPEIEEVVKKIAAKFNMTPTGYIFNIYAKCLEPHECHKDND
jgi:Fur family ferric uptake transcriptional regulator